MRHLQLRGHIKRKVAGVRYILYGENSVVLVWPILYVWPIFFMFLKDGPATYDISVAQGITFLRIKQANPHTAYVGNSFRNKSSMSTNLPCTSCGTLYDCNLEFLLSSSSESVTLLRRPFQHGGAR